MNLGTCQFFAASASVGNAGTGPGDRVLTVLYTLYLLYLPAAQYRNFMQGSRPLHPASGNGVSTSTQCGNCLEAQSRNRQPPGIAPRAAMHEFTGLPAKHRVQPCSLDGA